MTIELLAATPDTEIREIVRMMVDHRVHCLPILDDQQKLLGILTSSDVLRCLGNYAPLDLWL